MDNTKKLGEGNVLKLLVSFSIPAIVGMLVTALYNVVDRIFIGHSVGPLGLAGITIGFPIMIIQMAFGMLIGLGASSLISIKLGEKKKDEAEKVVGNAVVLLAIITVAITVVGLIFLDEILILFGASNEVLPYAKDYIGIVICGSVFTAFSMGLNNFIRAEGKPSIAMLTMVIGAVLNLILAPIFIFVLEWGMFGAGLAAVISQGCSAIWIVLHFIVGNSTLKIKVKYFKLEKSIIMGILSIGIAPFSMQLAQCLLTIILNSKLKQYGGDVAISGMGVLNSIMTLIMMPVIGINQGSLPIIGYNFGAKNYDRVKRVLKYAIVGATAISTFGFLVVQLFPTQLLSLFTNDEELIEFGSKLMVYFLLMLPIVGFQVIGSGFFQAIRKAGKSMVLNLSRQVLILIPALLILPHFFEMNGVLAAGPISDFLAAGLTAYWVTKEIKKLGAASPIGNDPALHEEIVVKPTLAEAE